jgi:AraC-like DNA-binding protein
VLPLPRRQAERAIGRPMSGREGPGALLAHLLLQIAVGSDAYRPADGPLLGAVAADLPAAMFARSLEAGGDLVPETRTRTLLLTIKAFICQHLADADLTPARIAAVHHISRSYLHRLFHAEEITPAAYIRRQRLEAARRDLGDPTQATTPIHVIAARCGYPCPADFTRAFRTAYGIPLRDYRRAQLTVSLQEYRTTLFVRCQGNLGQEGVRRAARSGIRSCL